MTMHLPRHEDIGFRHIQTDRNMQWLLSELLYFLVLLSDLPDSPPHPGHCLNTTTLYLHPQKSATKPYQLMATCITPDNFLALSHILSHSFLMAVAKGYNRELQVKQHYMMFALISSCAQIGMINGDSISRKENVTLNSVLHRVQLNTHIFINYWKKSWNAELTFQKTT